MIIAGLGYYFTVVPLYQKAAVDELIAKREAELKEAQAAIVIARREAYEQQRENFGRAIEFSAVECSDIRNSLMQPPPSFEGQAVVRADHERRIHLGVEVTPCLASKLTKYNADKVLTNTDLRHIGLMFATKGAELDQKRAEAIDRIAGVPELAVRDPSLLVPVGPSVKRIDEFLAASQNQLSELDLKLPEREERLQYQIGITQVKIADDYRMSASESIREVIRGMQWPKEEAYVSVNK
ncbi:hypothetical protein JYG33_01375 [Alcaligenes sp. SORT26]|uniref:hypothetical protein n=1 Tax=Alcaligenes sp. SORT26 TaxID=2813780 RepID=UPI001A9FE65B|nr:hypothetical protein [Alcaligenes sp. SORT26]QTC00157.1 hypothetical protein JYG33_01375 [Alcaligenes sp. SORT26]